MKTLPPRQSLQDTCRLVEDHYKLEVALCLLRDVDPESVNDHKTGDFQGDKLATEGLLIGTIQQVKGWNRIAWGKVRKLYSK